MMQKIKAVLVFTFICISFLGINGSLIFALEKVSMVKDLKGGVWLFTGEGKEKIEVSPMMELEAGDKLKIDKGAGVTVLYYYSEIEEKYLESSEIEIGREKGIIHKGKAESVEGSEGNSYIKIDTELPVSLRSQEDFGAFALRGTPPPSSTKYFDTVNIQRYAVVIGVSEFKDSKIPALKYADRDAQSFYDYLVSPTGGSFNPANVLLLKNKDATLINIKDALTNYLTKAIDDDLVIIYVASHGEPEPARPKNLYLLAYDSELEKLSATAYHMENVNLDMQRYVSAKRLIFFADSCHAGGIAKGGFVTRGFSNPINEALLALSSTKEGWAMITASRSTEVSLESDKWGNGHGAFTYFLLEGLNGKADIAGNRNGIVTITEAFDYLQNRVKRETMNAQHPVISGDFDNNLPLGFLPILAQKADDGLSKSERVTQKELTGTLSLSSAEDNAKIFLNGKLAGKTSSKESYTRELPAGALKVSIKKKGYDDYEKLVYINPDETSDVYIAMRSAQGEVQQSPATQIKTAVTNKTSDEERHVEQKIDEKLLKDNINSLIKELEEMKMKQMAAQGYVEKPKAETVKKPEAIDLSVGVPVSLKRFTVNTKALSRQRDMDILRLRVIDALTKTNDISVVERDLQYQEEILREQRMGGSILADKMYRIEIGRILGADFICFSSIFSAYDSDDLILRMEIVETATTLIDTIEYNLKSGDISPSAAQDIAMKIKENLAKKRKMG